MILPTHLAQTNMWGYGGGESVTVDNLLKHVATPNFIDREEASARKN